MNLLDTVYLRDLKQEHVGRSWDHWQSIARELYESSLAKGKYGYRLVIDLNPSWDTTGNTDPWDWAMRAIPDRSIVMMANQVIAANSTPSAAYILKDRYTTLNGWTTLDELDAATEAALATIVARDIAASGALPLHTSPQ